MPRRAHPPSARGGRAAAAADYGWGRRARRGGRKSGGLVSSVYPDERLQRARRMSSGDEATAPVVRLHPDFIPARTCISAPSTGTFYPLFGTTSKGCVTPT